MFSWSQPRYSTETDILANSWCQYKTAWWWDCSHAGCDDAGEQELTNNIKHKTNCEADAGGDFDREFLTELGSCMDSLSPDLADVSDGAWEGLIRWVLVVWDTKQWHVSGTTPLMELAMTPGEAVLGLATVMSIMSRTRQLNSNKLLELDSILSQSFYLFKLIQSVGF